MGWNGFFLNSPHHGADTGVAPAQKVHVGVVADDAETVQLRDPNQQIRVQPHQQTFTAAVDHGAVQKRPQQFLPRALWVVGCRGRAVCLAVCFGLFGGFLHFVPQRQRAHVARGRGGQVDVRAMGAIDAGRLPQRGERGGLCIGRGVLWCGERQQWVVPFALPLPIAN